MADTAAYTLSDAPWAILLAAGRGERMAKATGVPKQFLDVRGVPLFWLSAQTFAHVARMAGIVFVFPAAALEEESARVRDLDARRPLGLQYRCVAGGERRQDSVRLGLAAVPARAKFVLVHDAARPFFTPALANRLLDTLEGGAKAAIPGLPVTDTIKKVADGLVAGTLTRSELVAVQTPQGFERAALAAAHQAWMEGENALATDDAALMEAAGMPVAVVDGEPANMKITHPEDLAALKNDRGGEPCTGFGYDVHRYGGTRPVILGGVRIEGTDLLVDAHSDGDVLLHAIMDALLGLTGTGDIGALFPDNDPAYEGASSAALLSRVLDVVADAGIRVTHVDCTVVAQKPRISPQWGAIHHNLARLLGLAPECVGLKATTEEKMGFTGEVRGIKAYAVATGLRPLA